MNTLGVFNLVPSGYAWSWCSPERLFVIIERFSIQDEDPSERDADIAIQGSMSSAKITFTG